MATAIRSLSLRVAAACVVFGAAASADPGVPVRVEFRGAELCADGRTFLRELDLRDPRVRVAVGSERAPLLLVSLSRGSGQGVHGRLEVDDVDGSVSRRDVDGEGCDSVMNALALVAAIAVDPTAPRPERDGVAGVAGASGASAGGREGVARPVAPLGVSSSDPTKTVAPGDAPPGAADRAPASKVDPAPAAPSVPEAAASLAGRSGATARPLWVALVAGAGATTGATPSVAWTLPIKVELGGRTDATLAPLVRAGYEHVGSGDDAVPGGAARFVLNLATVDGCASARVARGLFLIPCVHVEGGALGAAGVDVQPARSETRPWLAVGLVGAARFVVYGPLFLEASLGARFPLVRDRFYFEPDTTVFDPPAISGVADGSVGLTIF